MKYLNLTLIARLFLFTGCATTSAPTMTPLEIQSLQTQEYGHKKDVVFPSVISVFQDLGYTIKAADINTGLITAESTAKSDKASKFWLGISKVSQTSATAFVEEIGKTTKVRLNFVVSNKTSSSWGQDDREDKAILDASVYKNAFERIDNAIFIRSGN
ncbi:hypothetical protein CHL67_02965 [Prosthecochloris sp. GSB1]|uniref:hypothetical protein n=1 Tax=Prosthecochloris sp. GSB1 TaxID=281093 RepID=UPI000B8D18D3|nr:hypothetical protein [Prosthecochloris sp. GSB1]ASQ90021.1 hypothetical protein CHL67_02965 [Prosthecochloris sp. GSB1]